MADVAKALSGVEDATTKNALGVQLFGTMWEDQGDNILDVLINSQKEAADLDDSVEGLNKTTEKMNDDPLVQFREALGNIQIALQPLFSLIANVVSKIAEWAANNPTFAATITAVVTALGILLGIFTALSPLILSIGFGFTSLITPILAIVAGITALIAIFVLFKDEIVALWENNIKPVLDAIISMLIDAFQPTFESVFDTISTVVKDSFELISRVYKEILAPIFSIVANVLKNAVLPAFQVVFTAIGSVVSDAFQGIKSVWESVLKPILNGIIDFITGVFSGNWERAWEGVKSIFTGVFEGLKTVVKAPINAVISLINGFIKGLNKLKVPDWIPGIGGKGVNIPEIPKLAKGGIVTDATLAMVGEGRDNEAVLPLNKNVFGELAKGIVDQLGGAGGGPQIVIQNMTVREEGDIQKIARELFLLEKNAKRGLGYR